MTNVEVVDGKLAERECDVCHKPYSPIRRKQKYCSHFCRETAHYNAYKQKVSDLQKEIVELKAKLQKKGSSLEQEREATQAKISKRRKQKEEA